MYILEILHVRVTSCVQLSKIASYKFHKEGQIAAFCDIIGLVHEHTCDLWQYVTAHMLKISTQIKI